MGDNSTKVLDAHDYVHAFLHVEVFEVLGVNGDGSFEWLLEDFCPRRQGQPFVPFRSN